jgi:hypothetical protein
MTISTFLLAAAVGAVGVEQLRANGKSVLLWVVLVVLAVLLIPRILLRF